MLLRFSSINFLLLTFDDCTAYCAHYFHYLFSLPLLMLIVGKLTIARQEARPKQTKFVYSQDTNNSTTASDDNKISEKAQ